MATHSSILAWKIPWTEEPGGLVHGAAKSRDMTEATEHTPKHMALCTSIKTDDVPFSKMLPQPFLWCRTPSWAQGRITAVPTAAIFFATFLPTNQSRNEMKRMRE